MNEMLSSQVEGATVLKDGGKGLKMKDIGFRVWGLGFEFRV